MKKKDIGFPPQVDFKKQTPELLIGKAKPCSLYEKAFLADEDKNTGEFSRNTTSWD